MVQDREWSWTTKQGYKDMEEDDFKMTVLPNWELMYVVRVNMTHCSKEQLVKFYMSF